MDVKKSVAEASKTINERMRRCAEWIVGQRSETQCVDVAMPALQDTKPAIVEDDNLTLPTAVDEDHVVPKKVRPRQFRKQGLRLECDWRGCLYVTEAYDAFQKHVRTHIPQLQIMGEPNPKYKCLWELCKHQSSDGSEMIRHLNYHAYKAKLMAIGTSVQFNLKLPPCKKDSSKRNQIPIQQHDYICRWVNCTQTFTAIQELFTHVSAHLHYSDHRCGWAGCNLLCTTYLHQHIRPHTGERVMACPHCGTDFANNTKFKEHLQRQTKPADGKYKCPVCKRQQGSRSLLAAHEAQHVCLYACTYCDMTTQTLGALAMHVRYRHPESVPGGRPFGCNVCDKKFITKSDLRRHIETHNKKKKKGRKGSEDSFPCKQDQKEEKKYICHLCPEGIEMIYSRGTGLTRHLVKNHGIQWPDGHVRFRYQKEEDGFHRLTTMRIECLEVSRQVIMTQGCRDSKGQSEDSPRLKGIKLQPYNEEHPTLLEVEFENSEDEDTDRKSEVSVKPHIEITMCDVDDKGNVIRTEVMDSKDIVIEETDCRRVDC